MPDRHADMTLNVKYLRGAAELYGDRGLSPATKQAAGLDLRAVIDADEVLIPAGNRTLIPTGVAIAPQTPSIAGFVYSRSGLGAKQGLTVAQGVGVIDADYRGEIMVMLLNTSDEARVVRRGDRIAQLVFHPVLHPNVCTVDALDDTERGIGGFGHTGTR